MFPALSHRDIHRMGAKLQGVLTPSRNQRELMEEGGGDVLTALFKAGGADLLLYFFSSSGRSV